MNKRIVCLILCILLAATLFGCAFYPELYAQSWENALEIPEEIPPPAELDAIVKEFRKLDAAHHFSFYVTDPSASGDSYTDTDDKPITYRFDLISAEDEYSCIQYEYICREDAPYPDNLYFYMGMYFSDIESESTLLRDAVTSVFLYTDPSLSLNTAEKMTDALLAGKGNDNYSSAIVRSGGYAVFLTGVEELSLYALRASQVPPFEIDPADYTAYSIEEALFLQLNSGQQIQCAITATVLPDSSIDENSGLMIVPVQDAADYACELQYNLTSLPYLFDPGETYTFYCTMYADAYTDITFFIDGFRLS